MRDPIEQSPSSLKKASYELRTSRTKLFQSEKLPVTSYTRGKLHSASSVSSYDRERTSQRPRRVQPTDKVYSTRCFSRIVVCTAWLVSIMRQLFLFRLLTTNYLVSCFIDRRGDKRHALQLLFEGCCVYSLIGSYHEATVSGSLISYKFGSRKCHMWGVPKLNAHEGNQLKLNPSMERLWSYRMREAPEFQCAF